MYESQGVDYNFQTASAMFEGRTLLMCVLNLSYRIYNKFLSLTIRYA